MRNLDTFDANQGRDVAERTYGYAGIDDRGGYFFTWLPTLAATLDSITPDEIDPPQRFSQRAVSAIRGCIRRRWAREKTRTNSLIPTTT